MVSHDGANFSAAGAMPYVGGALIAAGVCWAGVTLYFSGHCTLSARVALVGEAGIEPTTPGLEGRCSIRLSYSPTHSIIVSAKSLNHVARRMGRYPR